MNENRYAILIANSQFPDEPKFTPLRCPEKDADELYEVLTSRQSNFTEVLVLKNEPHYKVLRTISQTLRKGGKDDLYLIYYSGHGKLDLKGNLYLSTFDTVIDDLLATSIEATKILDINQEHFKKKTVLILDCCYSGAIERRFKNHLTGMLEMTFKSDRDEISKINDRLKNVNQSKGTYVLTASTSHQQAVEKEGDELSLFTKHIVEGIRTGEASSDGDITMSSLFEYVRKKVAEEGFQEPMKFETEIQGSELVIASVDVTKFSTQKLSARGRELIFVKYGSQIPGEIQSEVLNILGLNRENFSPEQNKKFTLIQNLIRDPKSVDVFVTDWINIKEQQKQIEKFYAAAQSALKEEEWSEAIQKLNIILEMEPGHEQASIDLELAQRQLKLAELYERGSDFYIAEEVDKAIACFEQIYKFFPAYKDVKGLLNKAETKKAQQKEKEEEERKQKESEEKGQTTLARIYDDGKDFFTRENWVEALRCFYLLGDKNEDFPALSTFIHDSKIFIEADEAIKARDLQTLTGARDNLKKVAGSNRRRALDYEAKISELIKDHSQETKIGYTAARAFGAAVNQGDKILPLEEVAQKADSSIFSKDKQWIFLGIMSSVAVVILVIFAIYTSGTGTNDDQTINQPIVVDSLDFLRKCDDLWATKSSQAEDCYSKIIHTNGSYKYAAYNGRGLIFLTRGNLDQAISAFTNAITAYENDAFTDVDSDVIVVFYKNRAMAYSRKGLQKKSQDDYSKAQEIKNIYNNKLLTNSNSNSN